jgi:hypothetical protein
MSASAEHRRRGRRCDDISLLDKAHFPPGQCAARRTPHCRSDSPIGVCGRISITCRRRCAACANKLAGSTVLVSRLRVRLGTLCLLRRSGLALHLPLHILRRSSNIPGCAIHRAGWRVFLVRSHTRCRLAAAHGRRSGTCVLQVCGSTRAVAGTCHCGAGAQNDNGATRDNSLFHVHLLLLAPDSAPRRSGTNGKHVRRPQVPGGKVNPAIV